MSKKCVGCGSILQTDHPKENGYVLDISKDYCMRCFRLKHYHEFIPGQEMDGRLFLKKIQNKKGLVFFFVDFLQISKEALQYFLEITNPKVLVISKCDLIPKSISYNKLEKWIRQVFSIQETILFVQKNSLSSLKKVEDMMTSYPHKDFYFLGMTNAGKSTFLNALLKEVDGKDSLVVESEYPNTTLGFIDISTSLGTIHDSAGIVYEIPIFENELYQKSQSKKELRLLNYPLKKGARLLIENFIELEALEDCSIVCLCSNSLHIQKVYKSMIQNQNHIQVDIPEQSNLLIKGVGVFYFKHKVAILLHGVKEEHIEVMPSYIGGLKDE